METEPAIDPLDINKHPKIIKEAQLELGNLDILVCGQCHTVFHFVEQFQDHRLLGNCSGLSSLRENNVNESKAQVWAFLLWKGSQILEESENSWVVYQRWCKMEPHIKEAWVVAGKNVQVFTKLSAAKMQEVRAKTLAKPKVMDDDPLEEGEIKDPLADSEEHSEDSELDTEEEAEKEEIEKMKNAAKNNGIAEAPKEGEEVQKDDAENSAANAMKPPQGVPVAVDKNSRLAKRTDKVANTTKECIVEKILAKRFNPRRKLHEYLIKWEGFTHDQNTWEPPVHLNTCQHLVDAFERNLARQKEAKAAAQAALIKQQKAALKQQAAGPSGLGIIATTPGGRPQRTSKQKALDQVKQWCGNISDRDDDLGLKRRADSDSDDDIMDKKIKMELDSGSEDEWQADESEIERHTTVGRPKILQKSTNVINGIARKHMTANEVARSIGLASPDRPNSPNLTNAKGVVKVLKNQVPNLASGVYIMSKKDGIVKLESSPGLIATSAANIVRVQKSPAGGFVRVVQKAPLGQQPVRVVSKTLVDANAVRLSPGMSRAGLNNKASIVRTNVVKAPMRVGAPAQPGQKLQAQRMQIGTPQIKVIPKTVARTVKPLQQSLDMHEEVEKSDTSEEDDFDPFPKDLPPPAPDSPPREFTLDPITGLVLGQTVAEAEVPPQEVKQLVTVPEEEPEEHEQAVAVTIKEEAHNEELNSGQDMPSLIMGESEGMNVASNVSGEQTATITLPENGEPLMITGEDGVVYQVAGQNENGQTLLVAQGADGQQQCVYVTATAEDGQGGEGTVLTLDSAVAEAMGQENAAIQVQQDEVMEPLTVNTTMEEQEQEQQDCSDDGSSQVVAQLVKAELPSPGGTRKVVLLLPDGNLLMTEVDAEQYAALELDK